MKDGPGTSPLHYLIRMPICWPSSEMIMSSGKCLKLVKIRLWTSSSFDLAIAVALLGPPSSSSNGTPNMFYFLSLLIFWDVSCAT